MPITVGGTTITFNDGTTQSTAPTSSAPTTAQVLSATAGATAGAVGSYAAITGQIVRTAGTNYSAASLGLSAGTYRCMNYTNSTLRAVDDCFNYRIIYTGTFLRIS